MNLPKAIYWFSTTLLCLLLLFTASLYFFRTLDVQLTFKELGYPGYLIYPLAVAKILAIIAILSQKSRFLKDLAYAGLFFNFTLAFFAHLAVRDGGGVFAFIGLVFILLSYLFDKIVFPKNKAAFDL